MISKEKKTAIMNEFARTPGDTGSPEVQVAEASRFISALRFLSIYCNPEQKEAPRPLKRRELLEGV